MGGGPYSGEGWHGVGGGQYIGEGWPDSREEGWNDEDGGGI